MNIHYKIVEFWPDDHLIVARYWTDALTEEILAGDANRNPDGTPVRCRTDVAINIPIPVPSEEELDILVKKSGPYAWLKMMEDVKNPEVDTDANFVSSILHVQKETTQDEIDELLKPLPMPSILEILQQEVKPNSEELTEADIQKLIDSLKQ
jgi:hypothetical protein